jgi:hypothetical protein
MAIVKVTPNKLVTDSDYRLVKGDSMVDAVNVSIAESGEGTLNVLKPHGGNKPILSLSSPTASPNKINDDRPVVAIGQVSDSQRGFIYFAVCSTTPLTPDGAAQSAIYQYSVESDTYKLVIRDSRLNFRPDLFVKMDVVNGDFNFNGTDEISTLLYFTDNRNPPRKINVDRALLGEYSGENWDYNVNVIKAASVYPPTAYFSTDTSIKHNNFKKDVYQFATQIIYKDGEESAISPYSKLLIPQHLTLANNEEDGFVVNDLTNNVAIIDLELLDNLAAANDVSQVRLLAKNGNQGTFFIVDQFNPNINKVASVFGQDDIEIYNSGSRQYRFYNETLGAFISQQTVNKLYDNVPFAAQGQTVAANRLMYSNYTEGRPNNPVKASIKPIFYNSKDTVLIGPEYGISDYITGLSENSFSVNIANILSDNSISSELLLTGGEEISFDWDWNINLLSLEHGGVSGLYNVVPAFTNNQILIQEYTQTSVLVTHPQAIFDSSGLYVDQQINPDISLSYINPGPVDLDSFLLNLCLNISNQKKIVKYSSLEGNSILPSYSLGSDFNIGYDWIAEFDDQGGNFPFLAQAMQINNLNSVSLFGHLEIEFSFLAQYDNLNGLINITVIPSRAYFVFNNNFNFNEGITIQGQSLETLYSLQEVDRADSNIIDYAYGGQPAFGNTYAHEFPPNIIMNFITGVPIRGFKTGSLHKLGVVYYDEYNRSGFVNDIGTAYAQWYNNQSRLLPDVNIPSPGFSSYNSENTFSGPVSFEINFPVNAQNSPPSWAKTYQIVYPGASSVLDFVQYTAGGAYLKRKGELEFGAGNTREIDTDSKRIYVSFDTLDKYRSEKSTFRDYSYTVGDKLRIVSWKSDGGDTTEDATLLEIFPSASDGSVIEFDVVGVELLDRTADNPIAFAKAPDYDDIGINSSADISDNHIGKFLVLECPRVVAGNVDDNGNQIKFGGFDWFDLANDINYGYQPLDGPLQQHPYPDGSLPDAGVHWYKDCLIEIYTPRPSLHDEFWYEIGEARPVVRPTGVGPDGIPIIVPYFSHGDPFIVSSGDVHYRPVPCKANSRTDQGGGVYSWSLNKEDWSYSSRNVEANTVSDIVGEPMWDRGRAHIKFEGAATYRRFAQITYSDAWSGESRYLSLSSFNATLGNFYDLDKRYGAARYISEYGNTGELLSLQENKLSITPLNTSILQDASGIQNLALSTKVLNSTRYFVGDYGCGSQPSAVLIQDNDVYFVDDSRRRVIRFAGGQIVPISNLEVSSQIELAFDEWFNSQETIVGDRKVRKIISGYDPENEVYYVTFYKPNLRTYSGFIIAGPDIYPNGRITDSSTFSYSKDDGWWVSKHSFVPQIYSNQNDTMFSCSYVRNDSDGQFKNEDMLFFKHVQNPTCTYYLESFDFMVEVVINTQPSVVKVFNAVSFEGDDLQVTQGTGDQDDIESITQMNCVLNSSLGQSSAEIRSFAYREGAYYSMVPMDVSSNSVSYITPLGVGSSSNDAELVFKNKLSGVSIPKGMIVQAYVNGLLVNLGEGDPLKVASVDSLNQITLNADITQPVEDVMIYMVGEAAIDGDPIRGHYCRIKLTKKGATSSFDLYAISASVSVSQYGHGLQD